MGPLVYFAISLALAVVSYLITPKPSAPKPQIRDLEAPTAEAGKPVQVLFGSMTIKGPNIIWYGKKGQITRSADSPIAGFRGGGSGGSGGEGPGDVGPNPSFIER